MAARRFLYVIAGLIMLTLAGAIGWSLFQDRLMRMAFVPSAPFAPLPADGAPDYTRASAWLSRPDLADDPSRWTAPGYPRAADPRIAVFYIAPTTYLSRNQWNAPLDDADANMRLRLFASSQASAFNGIGAIWAPRYRQASIGAFLVQGADTQKAQEFAYADVLRAWDAFVAQLPPDRPILIAGHSQGSLHLVHLLRDRIAGHPIARRIVAAYAIGWPISVTADLPELGLPACAAAAQTGCIVAWQSFAEPADPRQILDIYDATVGLAGTSRRGTPMLCVNPLTGAPDTAAPASANEGSLVPAIDLQSATIVPGGVPARCDRQGLLLIGPPPLGYGAYILPGRNYHVFDYALFWANVRADAAARAKTYLERR